MEETQLHTPSILVVTTLASLISITVLLYYKRCHSYWRARNVPGPPPKIFVGNSLEMMATPFYQYDKQMIAKYGDLVGLYDRTIPILIVNDPKIIHDATVKQFQYFIDRRDLNADEILGKMLTATGGQLWRHTRKMMSPAFTSSKMRSMNQLMLVPIRRMTKRWETYRELDLTKNIYYLTLQVIVRCAFGVELADGRESEVAIGHALKLLKVSKWRIFIALLCPQWLKKSFDFVLHDYESLQYFHKLAKNIVEYRKANPYEKREFADFVDLMSQAEDGEENILTPAHLMANFVMILIAGFETTGSLLTNCFFLLAHHQEAQDKLRESLSDFDPNSDEDMAERATSLTYLEAVIRETLRLYPPVIRTERIASEKVTLSNGLSIDPGTVLAFPISSLHRHEKYWTEPDKFDPDRFMPENKDKLHQSAFMPFHLGPRNCIGKRFALNEIRLTIIQVIKKFKLTPSLKTKYPLDYSDSIVVLARQANEVMVQLENVC